MQANALKRSLNVLIPTFDRPAALALTLTSLCAQTYADFDVIISDQTESSDPLLAGEVQTAIRLLALQSHYVRTFKHLPRRGMAEQRQFLLDQSNSFYVLYLDDDLILEPDLLQRLMKAISEEQCGFVGSAPIGLSYLNDERPGQQAIELWKGRVTPETIVPDSVEWERHRLHSAANLLHVQKRLGLKPENQLKYHVAWIGACVLYDAVKLREAGGFSFWQELPHHHCGEDVLAQSRLMERYGGCGIIPSGAYHLELQTTLPDRRSNAVELLQKPDTGEAVSGILIEVPAGELMDKISILEIKARNIGDESRLRHVREELDHLSSVRKRHIQPSQQIEALAKELMDVNQALWQIEDDIRECERRKDFGQDFIRLARAVYHNNDRRAAIKRSINEATGSRLVEEKSYARYEAAA